METNANPERRVERFAIVEHAVEEILEIPANVVIKVPRAGLTTSLNKVCNRLNKKLCIIEPTNKIIDQTLPASQTAVDIKANSFCRYNRELLEQFPVLKSVPLPLPKKCGECSDKDSCPVYKPISMENPDRIAMTYKKLEALWFSKGETAKELLKKTYGMDVLFLDEAHIIDQSTKASLSAYQRFNIPPEYKILTWFYNRWQDLVADNMDTILEVSEEGRDNASSRHLARKIERNKKIQEYKDVASVVIKEPKVTWKKTAGAINELVEMTKGGIGDDTILGLRDMIEILGSDDVYVNYMTTNAGRSGNVLISAGASLTQQVIRDFISNFQRKGNKTVVITSGTSVEPELPGGFRSIVGTRLVYVLFPDFLGATKKMTLIPSKWKLTSWNFEEKLPRIISEIKGIVQYEEKPVYVIAMNGDKAAVIREKLAQDKEFWQKFGNTITVDYYRSDATMGVEREDRVCIAVGFAETPANSCDVGAKGITEEERWLHSRAKRLQSVDAATWQALCRVKDPEGEEESRVYCLGCRLRQVRRVALWGISRRSIPREIKRGIGTNGKEWRHAEFDVVVKQPLPLPKVRTEDADMTSAHPDQRHVDDYILWIGKSKQKLDNDEIRTFDLTEGFNVSNNINCKNQTISSISKYRDNGSIFTNDTSKGPNELHDGTAISQSDLVQKHLVQYELSCKLFPNFISRSDAYAEQQQAGGYVKVDMDLTPITIMEHLRGNITVATYQINPNSDTVKWICFDLDNHDGTNPNVRQDVERLTAVLKQYGIEFLLEASGSPDSYHLWVFLYKTRTINAYAFSRQIMREAGVKCEVWPKQKHIDPHRYGNPVKLPLGINLKNGQRSLFLDPETFEPMPGFPEVPGKVMLCEVEGDEYRFKPKKHAATSRRGNSKVPQCKTPAVYGMGTGK